MRKKRLLKKHWSVSEKLEAVQARLNGLELKDAASLYGIHPATVSRWTKKYEQGGIAGLENAPRGGVRGEANARVEAAGQLVEGGSRARIPRPG